MLALGLAVWDAVLRTDWVEDNGENTVLLVGLVVKV